MRFTSFILVCFSTVMLASMLGCATVGGGQISGINWAVEKNDGKVSAFGEAENHLASTLINGITSSEGWEQGEGWESSINVNTTPGRRSREARKSEEERNWVMVELAQPVTVNQVKIYTIDSEQYPAKDFGVSDLLVQCEVETAIKDKMWLDVEKFGKGLEDADFTVKDNVASVIDVRFKPVNTQRVRILIFRTNDLVRAEDGSRTMQGTVRLTEIEVYGTGKHEEQDQLDMLFEK